jgi:hypothetical protein
VIIASKTILVLGGTGKTGSRVAAKLTKLGLGRRRTRVPASAALYLRRDPGGSQPVRSRERAGNPGGLDAHYRSQEFADFQLGLDGLLARPSESTVYSAEGAVRPVNTRPMDPRDAD